jgi:6-pyruvoyltetrahydropterin/6-carboxytetrahydropterin synthase
METFSEFTFEAAHRSPPFEGLHGHSFKVQVFMTGERDPIYGWSHNLYDVKQICAELKKKVDHKYLNDIDGLAYPTLENVACWIWEQLDRTLPGLTRVILSRGRDGDAEGCIFTRQAFAQPTLARAA